MHRVSGNVSDLVQHAHTPPERIDFDLLPTALAAEELFPAPLETVLADLVADNIAPFLERLKLPLIDFAQVAKNMCGHRPIGVATPWPDAQSDARQIELMRFHCDHLGPVHIPAQHHLVEGGAAFPFFENLQQLFFVAIEVAREQTQRVLGIARILWNKYQIE